MKINNGIVHDYSNQEFACDFTGCTFYFKNNGLEENKIRAIYKQKNILLFSIKETQDVVLSNAR